MKKALVLGSSGFIGSNLIKRLQKEGYYVMGVDIKNPEFTDAKANEFILADLRDPTHVSLVIPEDIDICLNVAALMGGAGFIFTGENDADIFYSNAMINLNVANVATKKKVKKLFFSSSACATNQDYQKTEKANKIKESHAYPANPDSEYGWEKLMAERLYQTYRDQYGVDIRIARFHNIYGENSTFYGGKEKAPAAICRKVAMAPDGGSIDIWGSGNQMRSFLYIDDCLDAVLKLMDDPCRHPGPINIGSEYAISINDLAKLIIDISGKDVSINNIEGPTGVAGRTSDNTLIRTALKWEPKVELHVGLKKLYTWIKEELSKLTITPSRNLDTKKIKHTVAIPDRTGKVIRYSLD